MEPTRNELLDLARERLRRKLTDYLSYTLTIASMAGKICDDDAEIRTLIKDIDTGFGAIATNRGVTLATLREHIRRPRRNPFDAE